MIMVHSPHASILVAYSGLGNFLSSLYRPQGRPMTAAIASMGSLQHNIPGLYKVVNCQIVCNIPPNHIWQCIFSYVKSRTQTCPLSSSPILSHGDEYFSPYYIETWRRAYTSVNQIVINFGERLDVPLMPSHSLNWYWLTVTWTVMNYGNSDW